MVLLQEDQLLQQLDAVLFHQEQGQALLQEVVTLDLHLQLDLLVVLLEEVRVQLDQVQDHLEVAVVDHLVVVGPQVVDLEEEDKINCKDNEKTYYTKRAFCKCAFL